MNFNQMLVLARHGDHKNNRTTPRGFAQLERSARWVGEQIQALKNAGDALTVAVVSSDEPRAMEGAARYTQVLRNMNIAVRLLAPNASLGCEMQNLGKFRGAVPDLPAYEHGFMEAWRNADLRLLSSVGTESVGVVGQRAGSAINELLNCVDHRTVLIVVGHGTTHEPAYEYLFGEPMDDMPAGGARLIICSQVSDYDPASEADYCFDANGMAITSLA